LEHAAVLAKAGHGQIVAAVAEAGVGKSRQLHEFKARNQSGCVVLLETISVSHGKATAYLPVIELLHGHFRITSDDDQSMELPRASELSGDLYELTRVERTSESEFR
jgi:hypothetical protein